MIVHTQVDRKLNRFSNTPFSGPAVFHSMRSLLHYDRVLHMWKNSFFDPS